MPGLSADALRPLSGLEHVRQSVRTILATPLGTRVLRREFGSRIFELIDRPMTAATVLDIYAATAEAVIRWEPRLEPRVVSIDAAAPGSITLRLLAEHRPTRRDIVLDGIVVA